MKQHDETTKPFPDKPDGPELMPLEPDMSKSRLHRSQKHQVRKRVVLFFIVVAGIGVFLAIFGIQALIRLSLLVEKKEEPAQETQKEKVFIPAPLLESTFSATSSATVNISGTASSGDKIRLYVNDKSVETKKLPDDKKFTFPKVKLSEGVNTIAVKALSDKGSSDFSNEIDVTYIKEPPKLDIEAPLNGDSYSKDANPITIKGRTDPKVRVTVNDLWATVDGNGNFNYTYTLKDGDNQLKIVASDTAGNKTEKSLTVKYSP